MSSRAFKHEHNMSPLMADKNFPVAFSLTHCSRLGLSASSHLVCALLISFSFLVLPLTPHYTRVCVCVCSCVTPPSPLLLSISTHDISALTLPSISTLLVYTQPTPSALSSHSPHLLFYQLKYGGGAGRMHVNGPRQSVQPRAPLGAAAGKPWPTAKPPCWMSRCCCSRRASRGWSRARAAAARSSPSPCTCPTCPPSWMRTATSPSLICQRCASSLCVRRTSCPLSPLHSSPASSSSSSSCSPPPSLSPTLSPSPSPWRCASATWSPRQPP